MRALERLLPYGEPAGPAGWRALHRTAYQTAWVGGLVVFGSFSYLPSILMSLEPQLGGVWLWLGLGLVLIVLVFGSIITVMAVRRTKVVIGVHGNCLVTEWWHGREEQVLTPGSVRLGRWSWPLLRQSVTVVYFKDGAGWLGCIIPYVASAELYTMREPPRPALQLVAGRFFDPRAKNDAAAALIDRLMPFIAVDSATADAGGRHARAAHAPQPGKRPGSVYTIVLTLEGFAAWQRAFLVAAHLGTLGTALASMAAFGEVRGDTRLVVSLLAILTWGLLAAAVRFWVLPRRRQERAVGCLFMTGSTMAFSTTDERDLHTFARFDELRVTRVVHRSKLLDFLPFTVWPALLLRFPDGTQVSVGNRGMNADSEWRNLPRVRGTPTYVVDEPEWQLLCDRLLG